MKIEPVLEALVELLDNWGLDGDKWVLAGGYSFQLQSYDLDTREGHLDVLVDREAWPWEIEEKAETLIPPKESTAFEDFQRFVEDTGFGPHFLPAPPEEVPEMTVESMVADAEHYTLPNGQIVHLRNIEQSVQNRADAFLNYGIKRWDNEKIQRWADDFKEIRRLAKQKEDGEILEICDTVLEAYEDLKDEIQVPTNETESLEQTKIQGRGIYTGTVEGKARIVSQADELSEIPENTIIISPMTTPDFLIGIEKISGVVTDKGGVGCHAAIIAREFEMPAVIGTENGTNIIKDGEHIMVDADNGVVVRKTGREEETL